MATCIVKGTIVDSSENLISGALVFAVPAKSPAITSTGVAIFPEPVQAITSTGYFELVLIRNMEFVVHINFLGFKEKIRVPDQEEYDLFNATSVPIANDPTPDDPGVESGW